jgi:hypothetical protein
VFKDNSNIPDLPIVNILFSVEVELSEFNLNLVPTGAYIPNYFIYALFSIKSAKTLVPNSNFSLLNYFTLIAINNYSSLLINS